jgi:hypothetical protein
MFPPDLKWWVRRRGESDRATRHLKLRRILWVFAGAVLLGGILLQGLSLRNVSAGEIGTEARPVGLAVAIPSALTGWMGHDEPLGPSEFIKSEVEKTLNYDDVVNRLHRKGEHTVSVYAAYWSAGRMPVQKVASHTPDRCWSENGWICDQLRSNEPVVSGGLVLRPANWRLFLTPGATRDRQYVLYWHLVGNELYDYGDGLNRRPNPIKWWRDTVHYAVKGSASQYFIRLTSNRPFEELRGDPGWEEVLGALAKLGLGAQPPKADGG